MGFLATLLRGPTSEQVGVAAGRAISDAAMRSADDAAAAGPAIEVDLASTAKRKTVFSRFLVLYLHLFSRLASRKLTAELHDEVMNFLIVSLGFDLAKAFGKSDGLDLVRWVVSARERFDRSFTKYPLSPGPGGQASDSVFYQFAKDLSAELGHAEQLFVIAALCGVGISYYRSLPFESLLRRVRPSP